MAFHWQTFRTRTLTAIAFAAVMLTGMLWNAWSFFLLFSIVHFGAWHELAKLAARLNKTGARISRGQQWLMMTGGWFLMMYFTNGQLVTGGITLTDVGFWGGIACLGLLPIVMLLTPRATVVSLFSFTGLLYISLPLALLMDLRTYWASDRMSLSYVLPLLIIFSLWINDTMAYIVGSVFGRTPLSPVSPKKTWEGTIGGVVLTVVTITLVAYFTGRIAWPDAAIMSALAAVAGTFGDLFESKLKRMTGVKDSGSLLPGHGGFLDRFDSLLFAAPVVWLYAGLLLKS